jgi:Fe-S cluster assembly protein SufD
MSCGTNPVEQEQMISAGILDQEPGWLQSLSEQAGARFESHGLPHKRLEDWKYTPLTGLAKDDRSQGHGTPAAGPALSLEGAHAIEWEADRTPSRIPQLPDGVRVVSLAEALKAFPDRLRSLLEGLATEQPAQAMSALNTAALGRGVVIEIADGVDAGTLALTWQDPLDVVERIESARIIVLLGIGARVDLVEHYVHGHALNVVNQFELAEGSRLRHARLQESPATSWLITRTELAQGKNSHFEQASLDLGRGLARHDLRSRLVEPGARCDALGAYLPTGDAHVDHHLDVRHEAPGCSSEQIFRGVVHDRGTAVFNGRVHVLPGADDSEAHQSNQNLLLSREAEVNTKPELIIEADEVVASHGATVGQLDESAIFYLRSRGVPEGLARRMLTGAFCRSVVEAMGNAPVRDAFQERLESSLEKAS